MINLKNTNLEVSSFALGCVETVAGNKDLEKKYKTLVKKMSTLIQKNGYIGTLVFCFSKGKPEHKIVLKNIINWQNRNYKIKDIFDMSNMNFEDKNDKEIDKIITDYIKAITGVKQRQYMLITKEMMILFGWMKRFADGMIEGEDENGD